MEYNQLVTKIDAQVTSNSLQWVIEGYDNDDRMIDIDIFNRITYLKITGLLLLLKPA